MSILCQGCQIIACKKIFWFEI